MKSVLIWGGGGHGKVVADVARAAGYEVIGFIDADEGKVGSVVEPGGGRVLLHEEEFTTRAEREGGLPCGATLVALAVGDNARRLRCFASVGDHFFPPIVHPAATISPSARIGNATVVMAGAVVNAAATIARAVIINSAAVVEHDCEIADGVHLSPRATLAGGVRVGRASWVGIGATIIQRIRVGERSIVAAGATVIRDVPDGVTVAGVPARMIRSRSLD
jgi:sugar O-acyltransferase (sialic acid O-acetyltransferase NeuD family)